MLQCTISKKYKRNDPQILSCEDVLLIFVLKFTNLTSNIPNLEPNAAHDGLVRLVLLTFSIPIEHRSYACLCLSNSISLKH